MTRTHAAVVLGIVMGVAAGCAQGPIGGKASTGQPAASAPQATAASDPGATPSLPPSVPVTTGRESILEMGTGAYLGQSDTAPDRTANSQGPRDITLNFENTDLREFVRAIMEDVIKAPYVIDPKVTGKVTIHTGGPISRSEVLPLVDQLLAMNGAAKIEINGLYHIVPKGSAARGTVAPSTTAPESGFATRIIPLQYLAASEMQKILEPYMAEGANVRVDTKRNLVIASGTAEEIATVQETIDLFDVDWLRGMSVGLYPLDFVDPKTMKSELDAIVSAMDAEQGNGMLGGLVRSVPIDRLNSLLLVSATPAALREVEIWLHRLDKPGEQAGQRLYVYRAQNAKATELAAILGHIFGVTGGGTAPGTAPGTAALAPGLTPVDIGTPQAGAEAAPRPAAPGSGLNIGANAKIDIIADDARNALVVLASPQDYRMVESALKQLDIVPLQVLIEASILEVTLRDDLNYGVEWFFKNSINDGRDGKQGRGQLDLGEAGLAALAPGFAYTVVDNADQVRIALNALAQESEVNVLSAPSLMVLDNETAMINVGDEIPVPTRQSTSVVDPSAPTVNEIQFRQTGVTLSVTPRVNDSGLVTMDIKQEVSSAVSTTSSDIDAPTIQQRQIESVVAINSGETIVLGGLIQDTKTVSEGGIPILHKIPVLGKLFGQTRDEGRRTELLVLLTPRVVRNRDGARELTDEFRKKLLGLRPDEPG